jgi:hypothetical protein
MTETSPPGIARFDSAAAMVQALAFFLNGREFDSPSQSPVLDRMMPLVNWLPKTPREWVYTVGGLTEAVSKRQAGGIDVEGISRWITGLFPTRPFPAAFIGSSNGALVHMAAALGAPWLPQTFMCPVRHLGIDPDDPRQGFEAGKPIVEALLESQPNLSIHHMQDPNQDRLMLKTMSYYRLKHRRLPDAYRTFLKDTLPAGATLYVDACTRKWPVTRTSPRSVFQFGAVGGATVEEYFQGGERVRAYFQRYGVNRTRWEPPEPNDEAPEAEWGFEPSLLDDIRALADEAGWRVVRISFEEPETFSFLTAAIYRDWYRDQGIDPRRLVVDSFILMDPHRTIVLHALPFWLVFNVSPSAQTLHLFLDQEPPFEEIDLMLFSHGTEGIGLASIDQWRDLVSRGGKGRFLGVDEDRYPRDFATLIRYHQDLARIGPVEGIPSPLAPQRFEALATRYGPRFGITVDELASGRKSWG